MTKEGSTIALKLKSGYSYKFENDVLKNIARIDLMNSDAKSNDTLFIADDEGSTTIPYIYLNGNYNEMSGEWGDAMSAVYILPYASEVKPFSKSQKHIGHIVAPNAYVHDMNGDVNGCFIVNTLDLTGSESHMFPYHGQKIKNNGSSIQPGSSQDGNEKPGENNPGTGSGETPNDPSQGDTGDNNPDTGNNDASNNPQPRQNNDNNGLNNENTNTGTETPDPKSNNDTNNTSTNNEIISNKEELTTNISRMQNTSKISSNKNSKVIVENNKQTNAKQKDSVKTGDNTHLLMYVLFELLAFVGIVSLRKEE